MCFCTKITRTDRLVVVGIFCALLILALVKLILFSSEVPLNVPDNPRYQDASLSTDERVDNLLSYMTLEEKIGQMALVEKNSVEEIEDIKTYALGAILSGAGSKPEENTLAGWQKLVGNFKQTARESRLGIPILYGVDAIHGHSNVPGATVFPHAIGLGATGDVKLIEAIATATAEEIRATGITWAYSPNLDLPRDIRWGRTYEAFSDDPELTATLGAAYVTGLQAEYKDGEKDFILATPKHYVGNGAMVWGSSSNENFNIDQGTTEINEEKLRTTYLPPFEKAIDAGAMSIMVGLNSWGDTKMSAQKYLIQDVLKDEVGFKGFIVSDWYGVYEIPGGNYQATVTAINAGVDMVMLPFDYKGFIENVQKAVRRGEIKLERIDDAVRRILYAKFSAGIFDVTVHEKTDDSFGSLKHRKLARDAVAQSLVLLKNENNILPVNNNRSQKIYVAGGAADNIGKQSGAWTIEWQGVDGNWFNDGTSILAGIKEVAGGTHTIEFQEQGIFSTSTPKADIGIAVVGESPYAEGWGDTAQPSLNEEDLSIIENLKKVSEKVVVVLITGRPLLITDEISDWDAVVVAWLPGSAGDGVADGLFGKKPFTGRLPLPWPASIAQVPIETDGTTKDNSPPLFPRYFGVTE